MAAAKRWAALMPVMGPLWTPNSEASNRVDTDDASPTSPLGGLAADDADVDQRALFQDQAPVVEPPVHRRQKRPLR